MQNNHGGKHENPPTKGVLHMMIDVRSTIASGMDRLDEGDVNGAQADYDLIRETYPVESEWMMDVSLRADLYELRDGIRNARKMVARV